MSDAIQKIRRLKRELGSSVQLEVAARQRLEAFEEIVLDWEIEKVKSRLRGDKIIAGILRRGYDQEGMMVEYLKELYERFYVLEYHFSSMTFESIDYGFRTREPLSKNYFSLTPVGDASRIIKCVLSNWVGDLDNARSKSSDCSDNSVNDSRE